MNSIKNKNIVALLILVIIGAVFLAINSQIIVAVVLTLLAVASLFIPQNGSRRRRDDPLMLKIAQVLKDIKEGKLATRVILY